MSNYHEANSISWINTSLILDLLLKNQHLANRRYQQPEPHAHLPLLKYLGLRQNIFKITRTSLFARAQPFHLDVIKDNNITHPHTRTHMNTHGYLLNIGNPWIIAGNFYSPLPSSVVSLSRVPLRRPPRPSALPPPHRFRQPSPMCPSVSLSTSAAQSFIHPPPPPRRPRPRLLHREQ